MDALFTGALSASFLLSRTKDRRGNELLHNIPESEKFIELAHDQDNQDNQDNNVTNNLSESHFNHIVNKQLTHKLQDYQSNYIYDTKVDFDKQCDFNSEIHETFLQFVNNKMYDRTTFYKFMQLINEVLEIALASFINKFKLEDDDIKLIFYNNVILKKIAERFLFTLPNKNALNLSSYFEEYFNQGTLEWIILLHPELDNYDKTYAALQYYLARVSKEINTYMTMNRRSIHKYFKFSDNYKSYILVDLASSIESLLSNPKSYNKLNISGYEVDRVYIGPGVNTYIYPNNKGKMGAVLLNNKPLGKLFQVKIKEEADQTFYHQTLNFVMNLKRHMFKKKVYNDKTVTINIPVKCFSMNLIHRDNEFAKLFMDSGDNIKEYEYTFSLDDTFKFTGASYTFICSLLEKDAYIEEPWMNSDWVNIYSKLMYFYFIDLFISIRSNRVRNSISTLFKNYLKLIIDNNKEFRSGADTGSTKLYNIIMRKYDNKHKNMTTKFIVLIKNIHKYNEKYHKHVKYKEFLKHIYSNILIFNNIFKSVYLYCSQSNDMFEENLYKGNIKYVI
jgi:hypothetical protein